MSKNFREMSVFSFRGGESSMFLWMPNGEVEMMPELNDPDEPVDLRNDIKPKGSFINDVTTKKVG